MKRDNLKPGAIAQARRLRRASTPQERILWQALRRHADYAKFRRQAPIGPYFVDFISHAAKLIIELDGSTHRTARRFAEDRREDDPVVVAGGPLTFSNPVPLAPFCGELGVAPRSGPLSTIPPEQLARMVIAACVALGKASM